MYSIGQLSSRTGVKVPTIRYYEEIGLIEASERTAGNQRRFSESGVERLAFIRHARDLGFSLDAIGSLIELQNHPDRSCVAANNIAQQQLLAVQEKIARLERLAHELDRIANGCDSHHAIEDCYVLTSLSDHAHCDTEHG